MKVRPSLLWLGLLALVLTACPNTHGPDFSLQLDRNDLTLHQGEQKTLTLTIQPQFGFTGTLSLSLEGAPSGVTLSPTQVTVSGKQPLNQALTLSASMSATPGNYTAQIVASKGTFHHQRSFSLNLLPPAGTLDNGFGDHGVTVVPDVLQAQGANDAGYSLAIDGSGRILVLGESEDSGGQKRLVVIRLGKNGALDSGFGPVNLAPLGSDLLPDLDRAIQVLPLSGKILVAGYTNAGLHNQDALLARLKPDGALDTGFGSNGFFDWDGGVGNDRAYSLALDDDGKIVFAGFTTQSGGNVDAYLARIQADGSGFDTGFGTGGVFAGGGSGYDAAYSVAPTTFGYVVAGTTTDDQGHRNFAVGGIGPNGSPYSGFNDGDPVTFSGLAGGDSLGQKDDRAYSVAVDDRGRIVAVGMSLGASGYDLVVLRLNADGSLDTGFGNGGKLVLDGLGGGPSSGSDVGYSVALDGEGRILVAGYTFVSGHGFDLFVLRLLPDGSRDTSFGDNGVFVWDGGHGDDRAYEVALDDQGWILVTGSTKNADGDTDLVVLRLVP